MRNDAWILEDDYDSEFRFAGRPVGALQALDRGGRVLYIGSFSKVLYPGLRLGYLIVPDDLVELFTTVRRFVDVHPPILYQAALADFIEEGHFARHLRRMRVLYGERAHVLKEALDRHLAGAISAGEPQAGMHMVGWLATSTDDRQIADLAAGQGIEVRPLSHYWLGSAKPALVLGFGAVSPKEIESGARKLAQAVEASCRRNAPYHGTRVPRPLARAAR
jgi:GntR family transcriptional regulator/MocR family aminotransferase